MTDVVSPVEETKPSSPELQAQEARAQQIAEAQQQIQMMEREIVKGRRMLTITCLNLANLAVNLLPRPGQEETSSKKNPSKVLAPGHGFNSERSKQCENGGRP